MRRVRYYLGGALFWGAFLAVCVLLFWNAQRLARAAGGISRGTAKRWSRALWLRRWSMPGTGGTMRLGRPHSGLCGRERPLPTGGRRPSRMLRVCGDAELLATEPLLYGCAARPGQARADARYPARWPGSFGERWM